MALKGDSGLLQHGGLWCSAITIQHTGERYSQSLKKYTRARIWALGCLKC